MVGKHVFGDASRRARSTDVALPSQLDVHTCPVNQGQGIATAVGSHRDNRRNTVVTRRVAAALAYQVAVLAFDFVKVYHLTIDNCGIATTISEHQHLSFGAARAVAVSEDTFSETARCASGADRWGRTSSSQREIRI